MEDQTASRAQTNLLLIVIRLLAFAMTVKEREWLLPTRLSGMGLADYEVWPKLRLEVKKGRGTQILTFYVDPEGATIADDQTFP
ncbi:MAG: hypothetical protein FJ246_02250 [Nitrospira sp.]|nr:hypothetical protein [Nitrospira sp.]